MTAADFNAVFGQLSYESDGPLLRFVFPELQAIALGKDPQRRRWLGDFLANLEDRPEKRELRKLLSRR